MAHAYTPGLLVTERTKLTKKRILPLKGDVLVKLGDRVKPDTVIAQTFLPGSVEPINAANILGLQPNEIGECMLVEIGDEIEKDQVLARNKTFFGMFTSEVKAKISGTVENISTVTGQLLLRAAPMPVQVTAYVEGKVTHVYEKEGVDVTTQGAFVQGIFGIGGEGHGVIHIATPDHETVLDEEHITPECEGKIVVGGSHVTASAFRKAIAVKAVGVVVGGLDDQDLRDFLKYDIGVAITGTEDIGATLVVTEGFGVINMARHTFDLFRKNEGKFASLNGATQIRAGVIRPEVIIPDLDAADMAIQEASEEIGLEVGSPVRVIRHPHFGRLGQVTDLPPALTQLESESKARVLEVEFEDGTRSVVPRANVEMLKE